jgi:hypothetical protein
MIAPDGDGGKRLPQGFGKPRPNAGAFTPEAAEVRHF